MGMRRGEDLMRGASIGELRDGRVHVELSASGWCHR